MTRKDYIKMANTFNSINQYSINNKTEKLLLDKMINEFCLMLKKDNNRFNENTFKNTCYIEDYYLAYDAYWKFIY